MEAEARVLSHPVPCHPDEVEGSLAA